MRSDTPTKLCSCTNRCREEDPGWSGPADGPCRVLYEVPEQREVEEDGFCCPHAQMTRGKTHTDGCEEKP